MVENLLIFTMSRIERESYMKFFYTLLFAVLAFMSLMQPMDGIYHKLSLVVSVLFILFSVLLRQKIVIHNDKAVLFFGLYISACIVAAGVNQDMELLKNSLQLLCIFFAIAIFFNDVARKQALQIVLNGVILAYIPFIILCFKENNLIFQAFAGVFENPNTMGFSMIGLAVVVLMKLYFLLMEMLDGQQYMKSRFLFAFYMALYLLSLYMIMLSNARTSLLTVAITTTILVFFLLKEMKKKIVSVAKFMVFMIVACVLVVVAMTKIAAMHEAFQSILLKMERKSANITDGRLDIWLYVLEHIRFWGHGLDSLMEIGVSHAHNTFINILQETGILSLIFYILFIVAVVRGLTKSIGLHETVFATIVIAAVLGLSTFEILYFNLLHILVFVVCGFQQERDRHEGLSDKGKISN